MISTCVDDAGVLARVSQWFSKALDRNNAWTKHWPINLNENKSVHTNLSNRRTGLMAIIVISYIISYVNTVNYLGVNLNAKP